MTICVAGDADAVFVDAGELGSVVPFDDTVTLASGLGVPSHGGGGDAPAGHADAKALTCTEYVSVALNARPLFADAGHVNDEPPTVPEHVALDTNTTPAGNDPDTEYPPVLSDGPTLRTVTE